MATANARGAAERVSDPARRAASDNAPAAGTGGAPPASAGGSGDPPGVWPRLRAASALAIGQLGAITALAFYFGWVRTQSYLHYFGLDTSLVDFTTTDYVLRSVSAAYWPLMGLGAAVVVALPIHAGLFPWVRSQRPSGQTY